MEGCVRRVGLMALFGVLVAASSAEAQGQRGQDAAPLPAGAAQQIAKPIDPDGRRLQQLLKLWSQTSTDLTTLDVKIARVDDRPGWPAERFEGRALFKAPNRAWLDFKREVVGANKAKALVADQRIVCTGTAVWDYRSPTKQIFIYPIDKQNGQRTLQEGPLPFLFNFREDEARNRYDMVLFSEGQGKYVVKITPREQIDKESFSVALISLAYVRLENQADRPRLLPQTIVLYPPGQEKGRKLYYLSDLKPNVDVADANFQGIRLGAPWTIHNNPGGNKPVADPRARQGAAMPAVGNRPGRRQAR